MARTVIDEYLAEIENAQARASLKKLHALLRKLLPGASEELSYAMPAFRVPPGKVVAGFAFFGKNCGYYPHSGNVVGKVTVPLPAGVKASKGGLAFAPGVVLPEKLVRALVQTRLAELSLLPARKSPAPPGRRRRVPPTSRGASGARAARGR